MYILQDVEKFHSYPASSQIKQALLANLTPWIRNPQMVDETEVRNDGSVVDPNLAPRVDGPIETQEVLAARPPLGAGPASLDPPDVANHNAAVKLATLQELGLVDRRRTIDTRLNPDDRSKWSLDDWRRYLAAHHEGTPQRAWMAGSAIETIENGIWELAKLGHSFRLVEVSPEERSASVEWPKMVYHGEAEPRVVASPEELKALGDGWSEQQVARKPRPNLSGDFRSYDLENHPDAPRAQPGARVDEPRPFEGALASDSPSSESHSE
jgi:hypothetical protein